MSQYNIRSRYPSSTSHYNTVLETKQNTTNVITTAINTPGLGADAPAVTAAQVALDGFTACQEAVAEGGAGMSEMYRADEALDAAEYTTHVPTCIACNSAEEALANLCS